MPHSHYFWALWISCSWFSGLKQNRWTDRRPNNIMVVVRFSATGNLFITVILLRCSSWLPTCLHVVFGLPLPQRRLWSTRRTTLGDQAFPVDAACAGNALPSSLRAVPSLTRPWNRTVRPDFFVNTVTLYFVYLSCVVARKTRILRYSCQQSMKQRTKLSHPDHS